MESILYKLRARWNSPGSHSEEGKQALFHKNRCNYRKLVYNVICLILRKGRFGLLKHIKNTILYGICLLLVCIFCKGAVNAANQTTDFHRLAVESMPEDLAQKNDLSLMAQVNNREEFTWNPTIATEMDLLKNGYPDIPQVKIEIENTNLINKQDYVSAVITIVDPSGTYRIVKDDEALIKIRGNFTSERDKKPYNIKFSGKVSVLGMSEGKKWCLLANRYDKSLIRNRLVYDMASKLRFDYTPETRYADVWLNDTYLGNYLITTPIEVKKNRVNIDVEQGDFLLEREKSREEAGVTYITSPYYGFRLAFNEPEVPTDEQYQQVKDILTNVDRAIASRDMEQLRQVLDVDSFIDLYVISEFFKNQDVDFSSTRFYCKNGILYAGPIWDADLSMGNQNPWVYEDMNVNEPKALFAIEGQWIRQLMKIEEFAKEFAMRYLELQPIMVNVYRDNELGKNQIDLLQEQYGEAFLRDSQVAGWNLVSSGLDDVPFPEYIQNVEYIRTWLKTRNEWLVEYFCGIAGVEVTDFIRSESAESQESDDSTSTVEEIENVSSSSSSEEAV